VHDVQVSCCSEDAAAEPEQGGPDEPVHKRGKSEESPGAASSATTRSNAKSMYTINDIPGHGNHSEPHHRTRYTRNVNMNIHTIAYRRSNAETHTHTHKHNNCLTHPNININNNHINNNIVNNNNNNLNLSQNNNSSNNNNNNSNN
jgi:hypothetical protein